MKIKEWLISIFGVVSRVCTESRPVSMEFLAHEEVKKEYKNIDNRMGKSRENMARKYNGRKYNGRKGGDRRETYSMFGGEWRRGLFGSKKRRPLRANRGERRKTLKKTGVRKITREEFETKSVKRRLDIQNKGREEKPMNKITPYLMYPEVLVNVYQGKYVCYFSFSFPELKNNDRILVEKNGFNCRAVVASVYKKMLREVTYGELFRAGYKSGDDLQKDCEKRYGYKMPDLWVVEFRCSERSEVEESEELNAVRWKNQAEYWENRTKTMAHWADDINFRLKDQIRRSKIEADWCKAEIKRLKEKLERPETESKCSVSEGGQRLG